MRARSCSQCQAEGCGTRLTVFCGESQGSPDRLVLMYKADRFVAVDRPHDRGTRLACLSLSLSLYIYIYIYIYPSCAGVSGRVPQLHPRQIMRS